MEWADFDVEVFPETDLFDFVAFCAPKTDFDGASEVSVQYNNLTKEIAGTFQGEGHIFLDVTEKTVV